MKFKPTVRKIAGQIAHQFKNRTFSLTFFSLLLVGLQVLYIYIRYKYLNPVIPLWFTKYWGDYWLAPKNYIYLIPAISFGIFLFGLFLILANRYYIKYFYELIWAVVIFSIVFLSNSVLKIIASASVPFDPIINPAVIPLAVPFFVSFFVIYLATPYFIDFAQSRKLITNPNIHEHPGMVLRSPSARGGGVVYGIIVLVLAVLFLGLNKNFIGIYVSIFMLTVLSIIDDYQNTHPLSSLKTFEKPWLRLLLLFLSVLPTVLSGIIIEEVSNPFDKILILKNVHPALPFIFTAVWIVWVMNVLSWSNGIDGQYPGIVGIASLAVVFLALRFTQLEPVHYAVATFAAISAGTAFGSARYNWHPSKIMWGFGAMTAGLIISALAISIKGKIVASILIILIPFMDAVVTVIRRIIQKKNPLSGDRGHLHHLLLDRGWSPQKISTFYWGTTALFGLIGILTPEKYAVQASMIIIGIVAFIIILMNLKSKANTHQLPQPVK